MPSTSPDASSGRSVVVAFVLLITFAVFYLLPAGDPALRFAGKSPTPELLAQIRHRLGLDHPWYVQFGVREELLPRRPVRLAGSRLLVRRQRRGASPRSPSARRGRCS